MPLDPSIALQVKSPEVDNSKLLNSLAQYQMSGAHAQLYGMQSRMQELKLAALQQVGQAMASGNEDATQDAIGRVGMVDPQAGEAMQKLHQANRIAKAGNKFANGGNDPSVYDAFPDTKQTVTDTLSKQDANTRANTVQRLSLGGALASKYKADPTPGSWDEGVTEMEKSGLFKPEEIAGLRAEPADKHAAHAMSLQAGAQTAADYMKNSGQAAGNQPEKVEPNTSIVAPNPTAPGALPRATATGGLSANSNPNTAKTDQENDPRYKEVPLVPLGNGPKQPGTLVQGQDPAMLKAREESIAHYNKDIVPQGNAAHAQQAELGTIESQLKSGKISTGITAKLRETVSQFIYEGSGHNAKLAQDLTKVNPETSDIMNKSSTRLGFDMARTQGAREAVQVITMALQANPNMLNTQEGALKLTHLLQKTAEWHEDNQDYAGKYLIKNNHLVGHDSWMQQKHPIQQYTSQAIPYQIPATADKLQDGVTYEDKGKNWKYNKTANHFDPVD